MEESSVDEGQASRKLPGSLAKYQNILENLEAKTKLMKSGHGFEDSKATSGYQGSQAQKFGTFSNEFNESL